MHTTCMCRCSLLIYIKFKKSHHRRPRQQSVVPTLRIVLSSHASHVHATRDALKSLLLHDKASQLAWLITHARYFSENTSLFLLCNLGFVEHLHMKLPSGLQVRESSAKRRSISIKARRRGYEPSSIKCELVGFF